MDSHELGVTCTKEENRPSPELLYYTAFSVSPRLLPRPPSPSASPVSSRGLIYPGRYSALNKSVLAQDSSPLTLETSCHINGPCAVIVFLVDRVMWYFSVTGSCRTRVIEVKASVLPLYASPVVVGTSCLIGPLRPYRFRFN